MNDPDTTETRRAGAADISKRPVARLSVRESGPLSDRAVLAAVGHALDAGAAVVVATIIATTRSVPRRPGSKMIVRADGSSLGSIGGGEMEARVVREAGAALVDGKPRRLHYDLVNPADGDPGVCGGTVELYLEPYMPAPTLYVIGCGHVGRAVVHLAHWLGFRVVATDDRPDLANAEALPNAAAVVCGPITDALAAHPIDARTSVVLVTRNVGLDLEILPAILATPAAYVGVMGSARRWGTTADALRARGVTDAALARVSTPIGVEIGAETPEEIAVSILAEVVAHRRGAHPGDLTPDPGES